MRLKEPVAVGGLRLDNRLVLPPMATKKSTPEGLVTEDLKEYYRQRAEGGCLGLVITEHSFVTQQGKASPQQMSMADDRAVPGLRELTDLLHENGCRVFAQISHAGGMAQPECTGMEAVAASAVQNPGAPVQGIIPRPLTVPEIQDVVERFVEAACRVKAAGFDGVEVHSAHAYLLNEFYSPLTNRRTDEYGGSLENRLRIHREIIRGIRERLGEDYPIAVRLGGCDYMAGGNTPEDAAAACRILEAEGVALLDISGGMCRYIRKDCTDAGYFADTSAAVKRSVKTPVLLTGGITAAAQAEELLQRGAADLIGVGRALLQNAAWAREAMNI
ncbi:NADH:flavin oxidoreductase [Dysosmobacter sp.]|uniref:NADH:flavin oxidoreductase n=1 Tax=Dysosmobacter sp. TaxID=2591382 RepID=UPI002A8F2783|nr:NADH:flavin oxidoreductase [Dysosmobacter sp.]MDY3282475.1 NADH:flavin oxidoreductase [Dysosmobacter sp.]